MVHYFHSDIAQKYGINAAVLAAFIWECIEGKSIRQPQLHEGKVWFRCSVQMLTGFFPYLSYDEIRYALKRLIKGRVLINGHFNESRFEPHELVRIYRVRTIFDDGKRGRLQ